MVSPGLYQGQSHKTFREVLNWGDPEGYVMALNLVVRLFHFYNSTNNLRKVPFKS